MRSRTRPPRGVRQLLVAVATATIAGIATVATPDSVHAAHETVRTVHVTPSTARSAPATVATQAQLPVQGRVVDAASGAPVEGASIALSGPRNFMAVTGAEGNWRIGSVEPGRYEVRVAHIGFAEATTALVVSPGMGVVRLALTPRIVPLDALVVTAGRRTQRLADAAVATELITRASIEQSGASDLAAVLTERSGIQLEGGHPAGSGVVLQGLGSERVLVLVDGQRFVGRISGGIDLSRIPASSIERIEVIKGPHSTLYGSEAMGGVINVITRAPASAGWRAGADVVTGSQGRVDASANVSGGAGPLSFTADLGRRAVSLTPGIASETDARAERMNGLGTVRWTPSASFSMEASGVVLDERQRWRTGQLFRFADNFQWSAGASAAWERGGHRISPAVHFSAFDHLSRRGINPAPAGGTGENEVQKLSEAEIVYTGRFGAQTLTAGVEARRDGIESDRVVDRTRVLHSVEPFAEATWTAGALSLVPGVRLSWSEEWGGHWTPKVAAAYRPRSDLVFRASIGLGYRAPGIKELYMEFLNASASSAYTVRGNPELEPEVSTNVTAGAEWTGSRLYLRGQLFENRFDRFIETYLVGDSSGLAVYSYGNVQDGTTRGIELDTGVALGGSRVEGGYAYLHTGVNETNLPLLGRAAHSANVSLTQSFPIGLRTSVTGAYTGRTPVRRSEEVGTVERPGFLRFDLRLAQSLPADLDIAFGVDNLLDARPDEWPGYAGRHVYLRFAWRAEMLAR